ncbi:acyl CoA:acetate/3-ketoacid CoA transferase [Selenomonadales bacterium OttesenSCG-928-I06]|nr:acyl CoA:acetate/3-ketoacid CoA transferase [Selenomonadales bacterium OttesenSCG-928-I06]
MVKDGDTVGITGAGMRGNPEYLTQTLADKYIETQSPKNLTLFSCIGHGDFAKKGDSRLAIPGLLKRAIGTHPDTSIYLRAMIENDEIEAYTYPQGVTVHLLSAIATKQLGVTSKIGLGTYLDPRQKGAKANPSTVKNGEDLIELLNFNNEEWLLYKTFPINVAFIRGTTADESGNITIEEEANKLEFFELAAAARACGGKVIAQVKRIVQNGTLHPARVYIPGVMVDAVVVCEDTDAYHMQNDGTKFDIAFCGDIRVPIKKHQVKKDKLNYEDILLRRAAMELKPGDIVNLGWGLPAGIGDVAEEEGIFDSLCLTLEIGVFGGIPGKYPYFGLVYNSEAIVPMLNMFQFYHGGGLDAAYLGAAQIDSTGNTNASKFGTRVCGPGGYVDITTSTPKVVICMAFTSKGLEADISDGKITITNEGAIKKFVNTLDEITFNPAYGGKNDKEVVYVTERCVFRLIDGKLTLTEIAPGIDLQKDILANMEFEPVISADLKLMDERIFYPKPMKCFDID